MFFFRGDLLTYEVDAIQVPITGEIPDHPDDPEPETVSVSYLANLADWVCGKEERKRMHRFERALISDFTTKITPSSPLQNDALPLQEIISISVCNRLCQVARLWDTSPEFKFGTKMITNVGPTRAENVLSALRKTIWINRCDTTENSIADTAESIRALVRDIVTERASGSVCISSEEMTTAAWALEHGHAYVVSYQHQGKGPGLTPVSERLSDAQIVEIATALTYDGMSKANQVNLAFDFTSLVGAQSEHSNVSWAAVGLDVFKFAKVVYVNASRDRDSDWCEIEANCALLYGGILGRHRSGSMVLLGSRIEFAKAEIVLAEALLANVVDNVTCTVWVTDIIDLKEWALSVLDTMIPTPNGMIPMLEALAPEGTIRDEDETWISLLSNANEGILANFSKLRAADLKCWDYRPYYRRWRDLGASEAMKDHALRVDEVLWGPESLKSDARYDYLFYNDTSRGSACFVIITNELSDRRHAWLIKGCFQECKEGETRYLWAGAMEEKLCPYNALRALEWEHHGNRGPINELCRDLGMNRWRRSKQVDLRGFPGDFKNDQTATAAATREAFS